MVFNWFERVKTIKSNNGASILAINIPWKTKESKAIAIVAKAIQAMSSSLMLPSLRVALKADRVRREARVTKGRYLLYSTLLLSNKE